MDALRAHVFQVTQDAICDISDSESVKSVIASILALAYAGAADAAHEWNRSSATCLSSLPVELLCTCFSYLDTRSVIRIACVCRSWRIIALSCPTLWAEFDFSPDRDNELLRMFFDRSAHLPLNLRISNANEGSGELVRRYLHRMRSVTLQTAADFLVWDFSADSAPILEDLECGSEVLIWLPQAPVLLALKADALSLNDALVRQRVFPALATLTLEYGWNSYVKNANTNALFDSCPNLVTLRLIVLFNSDYQDLLPEGQPPLSLVNVSFQVDGNRWREEGYLAYLPRVFQGHYLETLFVPHISYLPLAIDILRSSGALKRFGRVMFEATSLTLHSTDSAAPRSLAVPWEPDSAMDILQPYLSEVDHLDLRGSDYMHTLAKLGLIFSAVECLTLPAFSLPSIAYGGVTQRFEGASLRVPLLRRICVEMGGEYWYRQHADVLVDTVTSLWTDFITADAQRLDSIVFRLPHIPQQWESLDLTPLLACTAAIVFEGLDGTCTRVDTAARLDRLAVRGLRRSPPASANSSDDNEED